jgi:ribose transport system substrate-binding protein
MIITIVFLGSCSKTTDLNAAPKKNIALVLKMNYGYHWGTVKMGADAAAREFNVDIEYYAPDNEDDFDEQIKLVNQALDKKDRRVDALILAASDYKALAGVTEKAYDSRLPVIIIDSEVNTDKIHSFIASDNLDDGKKAGNILVDKVGKDAHIAIMNFVKGTKNAEEREEGFLSAISKYPDIKVVAKEYCLSSTSLAYSLTKKIIEENDSVDAIVALNSISCEGVARAVDEMGLKGKVKIVAFDSSVQGINYLENGTIQAMIIQNPFSMGYLSVKYAVEALEGREVPKRVIIDSKVVDKDNMYLPENQKLLFPIVK